MHSQNEKSSFTNAKIAQLVEHDLAKVGVAGSSPVFRSLKPEIFRLFYLFEIGFILIFTEHFLKYYRNLVCSLWLITDLR